MTTITNPKNSNPPYFNGAQYNPTVNNTSSSSTQATVNDLKQYFLTYPAAQGREFLSDVVINGDLIISDTNNQFECDIDMTMKGNILLNSPTNYIEFGDGTQQFTANNDVNAVENNKSNTFLSPYIQTFEGVNTDIDGTTAPLRFNNVVSGEYGSLFVDPTTNLDLTLYSNQSNGGLTIRNPNYSFTMNPTIGNVATFINPIESTLSMTSPIYFLTNSNLNNTYSNILQLTNTIAGNQNPNIYISLNNSSNTQINAIEINQSRILASLNLNMNNNTIQSCTNVQTNQLTFPFYGSNISQSPTLNPQIMAFTNSAPANLNPQFYYQLLNSGGTYTVPLQLTSTENLSNVDLNMNQNDINNCKSVNSSSTLTISATSTLNLNGTSVLINNNPIPPAYITSSATNTVSSIGWTWPQPYNITIDTNPDYTVSTNFFVYNFNNNSITLNFNQLSFIINSYTSGSGFPNYIINFQNPIYSGLTPISFSTSFMFAQNQTLYPCQVVAVSSTSITISPLFFTLGWTNINFVVNGTVTIYF